MSINPETLKRVARSIVDGLDLLKAEGRGNQEAFLIRLVSDNTGSVNKLRTALMEWEKLVPDTPPESTALICRVLVAKPCTANGKIDKRTKEYKARSKLIGRPPLCKAIIIVMEGKDVFQAKDVYEALKAKGWLPNTRNEPVSYLSFVLSKYKDTFQRVKWGHYRVRDQTGKPIPEASPKARSRAKAESKPPGPLSSSLRRAFENGQQFTAKEAALKLKCQSSHLAGALTHLSLQGKLKRVGSEKPATWKFTE